MPQYITIHRTPGLKGDELVQNAPHVLGAKIAVFKQIYANVASGFIVSVFEADSKVAIPSLSRWSLTSIRARWCRPVPC